MEVQRELYISQKRRFEAQQKERAHMQEMLDKYDVKKNSSEDNKKNKRTAGVIAQMKSREKALNKMEEEGLVVDPDAKQDEATIAIEFPEPWPLKRPLLVSLTDVGFAYAGAASAAASSASAASSSSGLLRGVSLSVSIGSRIGILGPNGAGKSTLLKLMTQQLQPTAGDAFLNRGARTAVFAQHFVDQLDLHATPTEFLAAKFAGSKDVEIRSRLARFGIVDQMTWLPMAKLSGGQKSRVVVSLPPAAACCLLLPPARCCRLLPRVPCVPMVSLYAHAVLGTPRSPPLPPPPSPPSPALRHHVVPADAPLPRRAHQPPRHGDGRRARHRTQELQGRRRRRLARRLLFADSPLGVLEPARRHRHSLCRPRGGEAGCKGGASSRGGRLRYLNKPRVSTLRMLVLRS